MKVAFLAGSLGAISGGNYVTLQHAAHLASVGDEVTLATLDGERPRDIWHPALRELRIVPLSRIGETPFDIAVPTLWRTVYGLPRLRFASAVYFVQSIETRMQPKPSARREACRATYRLPIPVVTAAGWIAEHLRGRYGRDAALARNGLRHDLYRPEGPAAAPPGGKLRVLVEGPLGQALKNVGRTLALLREVPGIETWLLTQSEIGRYPGVSRVFSRLPVGDVPAVYRACDVLVKLSFVEGMFGPPLEMFGCGGTAVVYDVTGADEYIVHGRNGIVCPRNDEAAVVTAVRALARDPDRLAGLRCEALLTARAWPGWEVASATFRNALVRQAATVTDGGAALRAGLATLGRLAPSPSRPSSRGAAWVKPAKVLFKGWRLGLRRPTDLSGFDLD